LAAGEGSDGRIYAIGGTASFGVTNIVEAYSLSSNRWTQVALMPTPRSRLAAAAGADGRIYAIGGADANGFPFAVVQAYTPASNTWTTVDTLPVARSELAAAADTGGHIFALGGTSTSGALNRVESLAVSNMQGTGTAVASSANPSMSGQVVSLIAPVSGGQVVTNTSSSANSTFVAQVYRDLLNRAVDPSGFATFTNALNQGMTPNQVVLAIEGSTEYRTNLVESFYSRFLGRAADLTGLLGAVQFLGAGGTNEQLLSAITGSQEYFQKTGATNDGFLNALYEDALGRAIDPSGEAASTQALAAGMSRVEVAATIFSSPEYQQKLVESYYQRFLRRPVDPEGLAAWVESLQRGATDAQVLAGFVTSQEYLQRAQL
jgi:hypothetical protein